MSSLYYVEFENYEPLITTDLDGLEKFIKEEFKAEVISKYSEYDKQEWIYEESDGYQFDLTIYKHSEILSNGNFTKFKGWV